MNLSRISSQRKLSFLTRFVLVEILHVVINFTTLHVQDIQIEQSQQKVIYLCEIHHGIGILSSARSMLVFLQACVDRDHFTLRWMTPPGHLCRQVDHNVPVRQKHLKKTNKNVGLLETKTKMSPPITIKSRRMSLVHM